MLEATEKAFKVLQKKLQKADIMMTASSKKSQSDKNEKQVESSVENEIETTKDTLNNSSKSLEHAVKGKFGKKLTETLEKQSTTLDTLK